MPAAHVSPPLTAAHAITVVKRLPLPELRKFKQQFAEWEGQQHQQPNEEKFLLACIQENSRLPADKQRRFNRLRRKRQAETLTKIEEAELQFLWRQVEQINVTRLEALTKLAQKRGIEIRALMDELGLSERPHHAV